MTDYFDNKGEKITEGFYKEESNSMLYYFTGKYDVEDFPIFEIEGNSEKEYSLYAPLVQQLSKIDKEKLKKEMKWSREKTSWIEQKLKEIEVLEIDSKIK